MEEPERPQPAGDVKNTNLSSRTSHILKRVSVFRTQRRKSEIKDDSTRKQNSTAIDETAKDYTSEPVLHVDNPDSAGSSPPSSGETLPAIQVEPVRPALREEAAKPDTSKPDSPPHQRTLSADAAALLRTNAVPQGTTMSLPSRNLPSPSASMSERRNLAPRLATLPPPMMARYNERGAARLTPSIVSRQAPMPILNLPTLPPPTPSQPARAGRPNAPLRSIPALPMRGPSESEQEADHENASLGDSDEDDEDEEGDAGAALLADEDEEDEDGSSPGHFEASDAAAGVSNTAAPVPSTPRIDLPPTPAPRSPPMDYFTAKGLSPHPSEASLTNTAAMRTPRPADFFAPASPALGSPRPGLYQQGSRSMVNLLSPRKGKDGPTPGADSPRRSRALVGPPTIPEDEPRTPEATVSSRTLRRQRSLPTYKATSEPPPYPTFHPRGGPPVVPREEEGREMLPGYANSIYVCAVMPRKLEFSAPGVQARDRKWRRVLCVLDGTVFRFYKCPHTAAGVNALEAWWEDKVGVGDHTSVNANAVTASGIRVSAVRQGSMEDGRDVKTKNLVVKSSPSMSSFRDQNESRSSLQQQPASAPPTRSRFSAILHPVRTRDSKISAVSSNSGNSRSRMSMDASRDDLHGSAGSSRQSSDNTSSARSTIFSNYTQSSSSQTTISRSSPPSRSNSGDASSVLSGGQVQSPVSYDFPPTAHSRDRHPDIREPDKKDLLRSYSLQHAESGLASDYAKRKNVIRVRLEGEQFLLQAADVAAVVDWIEGIQAATNIALDLDERPMPKGPMLPRRRRRRRAVQTADGDQSRAP